MRLFGRAKKEKWGEKTRVTYFLQTDKELRDLTVIDCADNSPTAAGESPRDHVLRQFNGLLKRNNEKFVRWWVEDNDGHVLNRTTTSRHRLDPP